MKTGTHLEQKSELPFQVLKTLETLTYEHKDKVHVFEVMQSELHMDDLLNPTRENLQHLILGRRDIYGSTYQAASEPIVNWAAGSRYFKPCIVETVIPKELHGQYRSIELKPEYIYRIYPRYEYFIYDVPSLPNPEIWKFAEHKKFFVIQNLLFQDLPKSDYSLSRPYSQFYQPCMYTPTRHYYVPLYVTKGKAVDGELELDQQTLSEINFTHMANIITAGIKEDRCKIGRSIGEAMEILSENARENDTAGFVLVKLNLDPSGIHREGPSYRSYYWLQQPIHPNNILEISDLYTSFSFKDRVALQMEQQCPSILPPPEKTETLPVKEEEKKTVHTTQENQNKTKQSFFSKLKRMILPKEENRNTGMQQGKR